MRAVKTKKTEIVKLAEEIVEKSNEPMCIDEIRGKFQLEFPFHVKKVIPACKAPDIEVYWLIGEVLAVEGFCKNQKGYDVVDSLRDLAWTDGDAKQWALV